MALYIHRHHPLEQCVQMSGIDRLKTYVEANYTKFLVEVTETTPDSFHVVCSGETSVTHFCRDLEKFGGEISTKPSGTITLVVRHNETQSSISWIFVVLVTLMAILVAAVLTDV